MGLKVPHYAKTPPHPKGKTVEFGFYSLSFLRELARTMINAADTAVIADITNTIAVVVSPVLAVSELSELCGVLVSGKPDCSGFDGFKSSRRLPIS